MLDFVSIVKPYKFEFKDWYATCRKGRRRTLQRKNPNTFRAFLPISKMTKRGSPGCIMGSGGRKKKATVIPLKEFYAEWLHTLRSSLLPNLRLSFSSSGGDVIFSGAGGGMIPSGDLLPRHVSLIHSHLQAYYNALDLCSSHDASQLLSPLDWRSPLEKPFLWLGDFHPSLFTNLLRSSLSPIPQPLMSKVEQLERGIRLIAPSITKRYRDCQSRFVERVGREWVETKGEVKEETVKTMAEELEGVFGDANRLRRSILGEIVGAADVCQAAVFLEALGELVVGFWDQDLLAEFEQCKVPLSP